MNQIYSDKEVLGDALTAEKTSTGVYNNFANECAHDDIRKVMLKILDEEHTIQRDVFDIMHAKGFYPTPQADGRKIDEAKQKFSCGAQAM